MTLDDLLLRAAQRAPDSDALIFPDSRLTYQQLADNAFEHARSLMALGIEPGEHVGILMPNCPEFIELLFGIVLAGGVAVTVNARYKAEELAYVAENADLKAVVTSSLASEYVDFAGLLQDALPGLADAPDPRRSCSTVRRCCASSPASAMTRHPGSCRMQRSGPLPHSGRGPTSTGAGSRCSPPARAS